jgi:hypothetical protein
MSTKAHPGPDDGYMRARLDEPMFTLLARDALAPNLVNQWAAGREKQIRDGERPDTPAERATIMQAVQLAQSMAMWRIQNNAQKELED